MLNYEHQVRKMEFYISFHNNTKDIKKSSNILQQHLGYCAVFLSR